MIAWPPAAIIQFILQAPERACISARYRYDGVAVLHLELKALRIAGDSASEFHGNDIPVVCVEAGWIYHHLVIPPPSPGPGEHCIEKLGMHVSGFSRSPRGMEWMRFAPDSPVNPLIQTFPRVAFVVPNLRAALTNKNILDGIRSPTPGIRVAGEGFSNGL